jgi:serine/threonine protein phosphatase PrpC
MHRYRDQPRQDRFSIIYDPPTMTLIVTVCDGVGQFGLSQEAAAFVAADLPRALLIHHHWDRAVAEVNERLKHFVAAAASRPHLDDLPSDARMATTLAAAAICLDPRDRRVSVAWTDDSSAWLLSCRKWYNLTPDPDDSGDDGVHTGRVKALPHAEPRLRTTEYDIGDGALFLMTDGVGVPLGGSVQVKETLADWWATPPNLFDFAQQVGFARRGHMDDRTVVGVWFEPAEP